MMRKFEIMAMFLFLMVLFVILFAERNTRAYADGPWTGYEKTKIIRLLQQIADNTEE